VAHTYGFPDEERQRGHGERANRGRTRMKGEKAEPYPVARPNISSERTAHSVRFLAICSAVACGPPLKLGVRRLP
jgi:hypothetical protein